MLTTTDVDVEFTTALPKAELHAHLSGSISRETLHEIWLAKQSTQQCLDLEDPLKAIRTGSEGFVDVASFFPLFDKYIYSLCNDVEAVKYATQEVIEAFEADGVRYLELRTTPRTCVETGMNMESYVEAVNQIVHLWNQGNGDGLEVFLILSIDRKMTRKQAMQVVDLAIKYQHSPDRRGWYVVGIDLCGNPVKGDVSIFTPAFEKARHHKLGITVHFAEIPQSATEEELATILSWDPDRLGHCVHVITRFKDIICSRWLGLELCLSCNVLAGLTTGGFSSHHLKEWIMRDCPIALCTDDVGIFGSPLSNEYLLAAETFQLSKEDVVDLSEQAVRIQFAGNGRMRSLLEKFARDRAVKYADCTMAYPMGRCERQRPSQ